MPADATWRRRFALTALAEERLREGFLGRAASIYGFGIGVSYGALVLVAPANAAELVRRAVLTACGVVGALVAAALLRDALAERSGDALLLLARENGFARRELRVARGAAALIRFCKAAGVPCVVLALVALVMLVAAAGGTR